MLSSLKPEQIEQLQKKARLINATQMNDSIEEKDLEGGGVRSVDKLDRLEGSVPFLEKPQSTHGRVRSMMKQQMNRTSVGQISGFISSSQVNSEGGGALTERARGTGTDGTPFNKKKALQVGSLSESKFTVSQTPSQLRRHGSIDQEKIIAEGDENLESLDTKTGKVTAKLPSIKSKAPAPK